MTAQRFKLLRRINRDFGIANISGRLTLVLNMEGHHWTIFSEINSIAEGYAMAKKERQAEASWKSELINERWTGKTPF